MRQELQINTLSSVKRSSLLLQTVNWQYLILPNEDAIFVCPSVGTLNPTTTDGAYSLFDSGFGLNFDSIISAFSALLPWQ